MWYEPCTQADCCVFPHLGSVETSLPVVYGIRAQDLPQSLLVFAVTDVLRGTIERPCLRREASARLRVAFCAQERSLQHGDETPRSAGGWAESISHTDILSYLHMLAPAPGFSTPCIFLTNFVEFRQQYKWLIFPLTVLLTCYMNAHPVTYVFKAVAKLKCIVLWLLTRLANINFYEVYSGQNIPSTVNNFEDIGPTFNFSVKVSKYFWFCFEKLPYLLL